MEGVYQTTTPSGVRVTLVVGVQPIRSGQLEGQARARLIYVALHNGWTQQDADGAYQLYLPGESVAMGTAPQDGGMRYLYRSALLGATFVRSGILDSAGNAEPPGTFQVVCGLGMFGSTPDTYACMMQA
jgi:hypothetical protein